MKARARGRLRAAAFAAAVFAFFFAVYLAARQPVTYGDGILYLDYARKDTLASFHLLYMPYLVGFEHLLGLFGIGDRAAAYAASAFAAASGVTLLALLARRVGADRGSAVALALLAGLSPLVLFFATTVEVHAFQLLGAAAAFVLVQALAARPGLGAALGAGTAALLAPLAHETGWLLLPPLAFLHWIEFGRRPLRPLFERRRLARLLAFAAPAVLLRLFNVELREVLFLRIYGERQAGIVDLAGLRLRELPRLVPPVARWPRFFYESFAAPAFALWLTALAALWALRRRPAAALGVAATFLLFLVFVLLFGFVERGAYFTGLVPVAVLAAALAAAEGAARPQRGPAGRPRWLLGLFALAAIQAAVAFESLAAYRARPDENQRWALDAESALAPLGPARKSALFLCDDMFHRAHLAYDLGLRAELGSKWLPDSRARPPGKSAEEWARAVRSFVATALAFFDRRLAQGPVLFTEGFLDRLRARSPQLAAAVARRYAVREIRHGIFRAYRLAPKVR